MYTDLQAMYTDLQAMYTDLQAMYTDLQAMYTDLQAMYTDLQAMYTDLYAMYTSYIYMLCIHHIFTCYVYIIYLHAMYTDSVSIHTFQNCDLCLFLLQYVTSIIPKTNLAICGYRASLVETLMAPQWESRRRQHCSHCNVSSLFCVVELFCKLFRIGSFTMLNDSLNQYNVLIT